MDVQYECVCVCVGLRLRHIWIGRGHGKGYFRRKSQWYMAVKDSQGLQNADMFFTKQQCNGFSTI